MMGFFFRKKGMDPIPLPKEIPVIGMNKSHEIFKEVERQRLLANWLALLKKYQSEFNWKPTADPQTPRVYNFINGWFSAFDAEVYHCLIREQKPELVIEIGSGNSTRVARAALDLNKKPFRLLCIDPNPRANVSMLAKHIEAKFEDAEIPELKELKAGDILFTDSTHNIMQRDVQKIFELIWTLPKGVFIHFHDIHLPSEYLYDYRNRETGYSEQYAIYALLESHQFEIVAANCWLWETSKPELRPQLQTMQYLMDVKKDRNPLCGSFWIRRK